MADTLFFDEWKWCEFNGMECWLRFRSTIVDDEVDDCRESDCREGREDGQGQSKVCA